jgi:nucleotide-binding universal stress UspA family protein
LILKRRRETRMFNKILYPTDFSNDSKRAVAYIKHLKEAGTREVIVLHVIDQKAIKAVDTHGLTPVALKI